MNLSTISLAMKVCSTNPCDAKRRMMGFAVKGQNS